jgi:iron complex outermembrane receptor protein
MNRQTEREFPINLVTTTLFLAPCFALAQEATPSQDEIVVVGTRGEARSALDSPVPVDVIGAEEIARVESLGGELGELLQALAPSFSFPRQSNSGTADHVRAAQLRGMSPDHVLVLVNGKRQHTAAVVVLESKIGLGTNPFDFNTIPLGAIERIEILRDGAGAQYGSDAIAGVINIVLKSAGSGGGVTASYGAHRTDFEPTGDTITDGHTWSIAGDYGLAFGGEGTLHFGAEYRDRTPTNRAGVGALPFFEEQTPANLALDPARVFAPGDRGAEDVYLWYNLALPLGERGFYSFARFARRESEGTGFFRYPDGFTSNAAVHPNGFRPITLGDNQDFSFTAGLEGSDFETDWDLSVTVGQNDFESGVTNSANPSLGAASPTRFDLGSFTFTQTTVSADLVRAFDIGALAGPLSFAYGAELRRRYPGMAGFLQPVGDGREEPRGAGRRGSEHHRDRAAAGQDHPVRAVGRREMVVSPSHDPFRRNHARIRFRRRLPPSADLRRGVVAGCGAGSEHYRSLDGRHRRRQPDGRVPGPVEPGYRLLRAPAVRRAFADRHERRLLLRTQRLRFLTEFATISA